MKKISTWWRDITESDGDVQVQEYSSETEDSIDGQFSHASTPEDSSVDPSTRSDGHECSIQGTSPELSFESEELWPPLPSQFLRFAFISSDSDATRGPRLDPEDKMAKRRPYASNSQGDRMSSEPRRMGPPQECNKLNKSWQGRTTVYESSSSNNSPSDAQRSRGGARPKVPGGRPTPPRTGGHPQLEKHKNWEVRDMVRGTPSDTSSQGIRGISTSEQESDVAEQIPVDAAEGIQQCGRNGPEEDSQATKGRALEGQGSRDGAQLTTSAEVHRGNATDHRGSAEGDQHPPHELSATSNSATQPQEGTSGRPATHGSHATGIPASGTQQQKHRDNDPRVGRAQQSTSQGTHSDGVNQEDRGGVCATREERPSLYDEIEEAAAFWPSPSVASEGAGAQRGAHGRPNLLPTPGHTVNFAHTMGQRPPHVCVPAATESGASGPLLGHQPLQVGSIAGNAQESDFVGGGAQVNQPAAEPSGMAFTAVGGSFPDGDWSLSTHQSTQGVSTQDPPPILYGANILPNGQALGSPFSPIRLPFPHLGSPDLGMFPIAPQLIPASFSPGYNAGLGTAFHAQLPIQGHLAPGNVEVHPDTSTSVGSAPQGNEVTTTPGMATAIRDNGGVASRQRDRGPRASETNESLAATVNTTRSPKVRGSDMEPNVGQTSERECRPECGTRIQRGSCTKTATAGGRHQRSTYQLTLCWPAPGSTSEVPRLDIAQRHEQCDHEHGGKWELARTAAESGHAGLRVRPHSTPVSTDVSEGHSSEEPSGTTTGGPGSTLSMATGFRRPQANRGFDESSRAEEANAEAPPGLSFIREENEYLDATLTSWIGRPRLMAQMEFRPGPHGEIITLDGDMRRKVQRQGATSWHDFTLQVTEYDMDFRHPDKAAWQRVLREHQMTMDTCRCRFILEIYDNLKKGSPERGFPKLIANKLTADGITVDNANDAFKLALHFREMRSFLLHAEEIVAYCQNHLEYCSELQDGKPTKYNIHIRKDALKKEELHAVNSLEHHDNSFRTFRRRVCCFLQQLCLIRDERTSHRHKFQSVGGDLETRALNHYHHYVVSARRRAATVSSMGRALLHALIFGMSLVLAATLGGMTGIIFRCIRTATKHHYANKRGDNETANGNVYCHLARRGYPGQSTRFPNGRQDYRRSTGAPGMHTASEPPMGQDRHDYQNFQEESMETTRPTRQSRRDVSTSEGNTDDAIDRVLKRQTEKAQRRWQRDDTPASDDGDDNERSGYDWDDGHTELQTNYNDVASFVDTCMMPRRAQARSRQKSSQRQPRTSAGSIMTELIQQRKMRPDHVDAITTEPPKLHVHLDWASAYRLIQQRNGGFDPDDVPTPSPYAAFMEDCQAMVQDINQGDKNSKPPSKKEIDQRLRHIDMYYAFMPPGQHMDERQYIVNCYMIGKAYIRYLSAEKATRSMHFALPAFGNRDKPNLQAFHTANIKTTLLTELLETWEDVVDYSSAEKLSFDAFKGLLKIALRGPFVTPMKTILQESRTPELLVTKMAAYYSPSIEQDAKTRLSGFQREQHETVQAAFLRAKALILKVSHKFPAQSRNHMVTESCLDMLKSMTAHTNQKIKDKLEMRIRHIQDNGRPIELDKLVDYVAGLEHEHRHVQTKSTDHPLVIRRFARDDDDGGDTLDICKEEKVAAVTRSASPRKLAAEARRTASPYHNSQKNRDSKASRSSTPSISVDAKKLQEKINKTVTTETKPQTTPEATTVPTSFRQPFPPDPPPQQMEVETTPAVVETTPKTPSRPQTPKYGHHSRPPTRTYSTRSDSPIRARSAGGREYEYARDNSTGKYDWRQKPMESLPNDRPYVRLNQDKPGGFAITLPKGFKLIPKSQGWTQQAREYAATEQARSFQQPTTGNRPSSPMPGWDHHLANTKVMEQMTHIIKQQQDNLTHLTALAKDKIHRDKTQKPAATVKRREKKKEDTPTVAVYSEGAQGASASSEEEADDDDEAQNPFQ